MALGIGNNADANTSLASQVCSSTEFARAIAPSKSFERLTSRSIMSRVFYAALATAATPGAAATTAAVGAPTRVGEGLKAVLVTWLHDFFYFSTCSTTVDQTLKFHSFGMIA